MQLCGNNCDCKAGSRRGESESGMGSASSDRAAGGVFGEGELECHGD